MINLIQEFNPKGHTAHDRIGLLRNKLDERVVSRNGPVNWPSLHIFLDLTSLDIFLWVKSMITASKATTLKELRANIERKIAVVIVEKGKTVIENWVQRIDRC